MAAKKKSIFKRPGLRLSLVLSILMLLLVIIMLLFWLTSQSLFSRNRHFVIRQIDVESSGWWRGRQGKVMQILEVEPGVTNLFALELAELRQTMESQPSIEKVVVSRVLPDILKVKIIERIPRAFLYWAGSDWVVDSTGIVMLTDTCINLSKDLPVITGFRKQESLQAGQDLPQLSPALALLHPTATKHTVLQISRINLSNPRELKITFTVSQLSKEYTAYLPRTKMDMHLRVLRKALAKSLRNRDPRKNFDLRYKGQVIVN